MKLARDNIFVRYCASAIAYIKTAARLPLL